MNEKPDSAASDLGACARHFEELANRGEHAMGLAEQQINAAAGRIVAATAEGLPAALRDAIAQAVKRHSPFLAGDKSLLTREQWDGVGFAAVFDECLRWAAARSPAMVLNVPAAGGCDVQETAALSRLHWQISIRARAAAARMIAAELERQTPDRGGVTVRTTLEKLAESIGCDPRTAKAMLKLRRVAPQLWEVEVESLREARRLWRGEQKSA